MGRETMHSEQLLKEVFLVFNTDQEKEFKEQRNLSHIISTPKANSSHSKAQWHSENSNRTKKSFR